MIDSKLLNHMLSDTIREHKRIDITPLSHIIESDIIFKKDEVNTLL